MLLKSRKRMTRKVMSYIIAYVPVLLITVIFIHFMYFSNPTKTISGFELIYTSELPQYNAKLYMYEHQKHGSPFIHIETKDKHNFFATTFRTTCIDDSGSTHVLEHLTLHGSKKYPIRSVFMELIKNSVATFLNAFTSVEWTAYPFSSMNYKDFHNVMDVYMDSIFHPKLDEIDFKSEAYHLEFSSPENSSTPLRHSGVVYNEMNGDISNPESRFESLIREHLYPNSLFRYQYGGNPEAITNLTLQKIVEQHDRYYHPCNALFFHYGSFDEKEIMKKINDVIEPFDKKNITIPDELIDQPMWDKPRFVEREGPASENLSNARASVNWMVGDLRNPTDISDLNFLTLLLTYSQASPLYIGLVKSGIGTKFMNTGFFPYVRSPYLTIGLEGIEIGAARKLNETVLGLLNKIYKEGFNKSHIDAILHQYDIQQRMVSSSQGMNMWEAIVGQWIHDVDPVELLDTESDLKRIKGLLEQQPRYFEILMKDVLINNPHRLDLVMKGVEGFEEKQSKKIKQDLEERKQKMTEEEKEEIVKTAKEIREAVDAPKPLELLPKIRVEDLNVSCDPIKPEIDNNIWYFDQPTKGIAYVTLKCDLPLNRKNIADMSLLQRVFCSVGAGDMKEAEFSVKENLYTGGISADLSVVPPIKKGDALKGSFVIRTNSLVEDFDKMLELVEKVLLSPRINDTDAIKTVFQSIDSTFASSIAADGHNFAFQYSSSSISEGASLSEMWAGFTANKMLHKVVEENDWKKAAQRLNDAYENILMHSTFSASIHCSGEHKEVLKKKLSVLIEKMNEIAEKRRNNNKDSSNAIVEFMNNQKKSKNTVIDIDSSTFFCSVSMKSPMYYEENSIARKIAQMLIRSEFLHDMVREKLGAYGVMMRNDLYSGACSFVSYRDTNPKEVMDAFKKGIELAITSTTQEMVDRAILQMFSDLDTPESPSSIGLNMFLRGTTNEDRARIRKEVIKVKAVDVINEARAMKESMGEWCSAIVGSSALIPEMVKQNNYTIAKV